MNWYLVKMVFQIICGEGKHTAQFEEQLRLIQAADGSLAVKKATLLGKEEEQSFLNFAQQPVNWKLIAVTDIYPFDAAMDGAEIFSRISEEEQAAAFIHSMQLRSADAAKRITGIYQF
jgi:Domain of unknown function (DUF4288)